MFATGIENSIPTIDNGRTRVDQMESCGHYKHWKLDFDCVEELGLRFLRYGPPLHRTYLGPGRYDWEFADLTFADLKRRDIIPIVDLCHFGVPDWIGDFQNPDLPHLFARYAGDFAERYPWVQLYTPMNEMFICAVFSAMYGWWNEQLQSDRAFVTALKHIVKANVMAMTEILKRRPDAIFIQSESSEYFHADSPAAIHEAELRNRWRFLPLDLNYGNRVNSEMYEYLLENGMTKEEYNWFLTHRLKQHCILGNDYYLTNEHRVFADGHSEASGEVFGYAEITRQYYERYGLPIMHTETNMREGPTGQEAVQWLWKEWANVLRIRNVGIPTVGFTWYSLTDQIDWDTALRERNNRVHPVGLYDLDRNIRPVGRAYKKLIADWRELLPASSLCLVVPVVPPSRAESGHAREQREAAAEHLDDVSTEASSPEIGG
ncbi:family 1 glycosylhydrolase [Sphingosinicella ginsenosidimutans]|uniref:Family 1 glycosylhydrolase n=1 Tax=Allosphingosinicella ginsenosidimutans TaxID=1176539 RepID=A0A5C6TUX2_9SPHN|nr:family 1 glycosylhydrolase [Sphingosinicella ginsenosidimutans]TXC64192.1 family 1 glycosylhydrolase [Sphingosinicella ginsenosidimutans]